MSVSHRFLALLFALQFFTLDGPQNLELRKRGKFEASYSSVAFSSYFFFIRRFLLPMSLFLQVVHYQYLQLWAFSAAMASRGVRFHTLRSITNSFLLDLLLCLDYVAWLFIWSHFCGHAICSSIIIIFFSISMLLTFFFSLRILLIGATRRLGFWSSSDFRL